MQDGDWENKESEEREQENDPSLSSDGTTSGSSKGCQLTNTWGNHFENLVWTECPLCLLSSSCRKEGWEESQDSLSSCSNKMD